MAHLTLKQRWEIGFLHNHELEPKDGFKKIAKYTKCSRDSVQHWIVTYEKTGDVQDKSGRDGKRKTSEKEDEKFIDLAGTHNITSSDIARIYKKRRG